jgi:esterase/lipase superfamily enzyme
MKKALYLLLLTLILPGCASVPLRESSESVEGTLYRRIPSKAEGRDRVITLFFASSRQIQKRDGKLHFDPELADSPTLGRLDCRINPLVKIGKVNPPALKKRGVVRVQGIERLSDADFIKDISEAVEASPHKSLLVLVHGFKDNFEMTAVKLAYFTYLLDANTPVLIFDWPGDQSVTPWGYRKAVKLAAASGPYLGNVVARIIREVKPQKLWIQSASLGCQVVCSAFEWMHQQPDLADAETEISHVLLSAPDVSKDEFNNKFKDELLALTDKLTVYVSSDDHALLVARILGGEKKFGRQSVPVTRQEQFQETSELLYLKSLVPDKLSIVDVTPINHASYHHGYDLEAPEFYDDFYMRILGASEYKNRRLYIVNTEKNTDYWVMRSDR